MKKWTYLFLALIGLFVLSGCGEPGEKGLRNNAKSTLEWKLQKSIDDLKSDKKLSNYLLEAEYKESFLIDENSLDYDIAGKLNDSFDTLSKKEQYDFLAHAVDVIRKVFKESNGEVNCKDYSCYVWSIEFSTSTKKYEMVYTAFADKKDLVIGSEKYKVDGSLVVEKPPSESTASTGSYAEDVTSESVSEMDLSTTNGEDWIQMYSSQKSEVVSTVLSNLKEKGYTILEGKGWFVDALNAFYGDEATNSTKVTEAVVLAGFGGKVIIAP